MLGDPLTVRPCNPPRNTTNSVTRAVTLLDSFVEGGHLNLTQLAERAGLSKSTALRLLRTLSAAGMVRRVGDRYVLGDRLITLGASASDDSASRAQDRLREIAMPFLQELYSSSGQTVHLAVRSGIDVVYLEKLFGHRRVDSPSRVGARCRASCTAVGKAILAHSDAAVVARAAQRLEMLTPYSLPSPAALLGHLDTVRSTGLATDVQESRLGLQCVAAPVMSKGEGCVAAVSITWAYGAFDTSAMAPMIIRTATNIGRALDATAQGTPWGATITQKTSELRSQRIRR